MPILDDHAPDPGRAFFLTLSNASGGAQAGVDLRIDVEDDEPAGWYDLAFFDYDAAGLWTYNEVLGWAQINAADPEAVVADGWRRAFVDYGPYGLWAWDGVRSWRKLNDVSPEAMVVDDAGRLYLDYGVQGLWAYSDPGNWEKLDADDPVRIVGDGSSMLADFGAGGLRIAGAGGYRSISPYSPQSIGPGTHAYYLDFGAGGLWRYRYGDSAPWLKVSDRDVEAVAGAANGAFVDLGPEGLGWWTEGMGLTPLGGVDPGPMTSGLYGVYVDQGPAGLWLRDASGAAWLIDPLALSAIGAGPATPDAYFAFAGGGLWRWSPGGYIKLNDVAPRSVARM